MRHQPITKNSNSLLLGLWIDVTQQPPMFAGLVEQIFQACYQAGGHFSLFATARGDKVLCPPAQSVGVRDLHHDFPSNC